MAEAKIALFLPSLESGGAEKVLALLANWFNAQGVETHMLLGCAKGIWLDSLSPGVRVEDLGCPEMRKAPVRLRSYLRAARPDAVFSALTHANLALITATRVLGNFPGRVVVQETQPLDHSRVLAWGQKERVFMAMARLLYGRADAVTAVSASVARSMASIPSQVLPNPIDLAAVQASAAQEASHPWLGDDEAPVIMAMGRLSREKGFDTLLRATALARQKKDLRLIILGEGPERTQLEDLVRQLGLEGSVELPGFEQNPHALMARADLFVLSSLGEGFSLALAEALACGCNVVTTACGQEPLNMVENGRFGTVAPAGDAPALAKAILERLNDPLPAEELMARALPYGLEQMGRRYLELLLPGRVSPVTGG